MTYNSLINRTEASPLIPEEAARQIMQGAVQQSTVLQLARRLPDIPRQVLRIPVLDVLPTAYFTTGDTGYKQTSEVNWRNVNLTAEELNVIVPIPINVLEDTDYDVWDQIRPRLEEAFGRAIDRAVLHETNKPSSWPTGILAGATSAGHVVDLSNAEAAGDDLYDAVLGRLGGGASAGVFGLVEEDGFMPTGVIAGLTMRSRMRGLRDSNGGVVFTYSQDQGRMSYQLDGTTALFSMNDGVDTSAALLFAGDWNQLVYAMRRDITYRVLDQGVITNASNVIQYNLPQQGMVALMATMRLGFALPNPETITNTNDSTRYPFAVLVP